MFGAELVAGYVFAWLVRKAGRVGVRADGHLDAVLDAAVDRSGERLLELVSGRLQGDPAFERLASEAEQGLEEPTARTTQRVTLALEDAAEDDPAFGQDVGALVAELKAAFENSGSVRAADGGFAAGGDIDIQATGGAVVAGKIVGNVSTNPQMPGTNRG